MKATTIFLVMLVVLLPATASADKIKELTDSEKEALSTKEDLLFSDSFGLETLLEIAKRVGLAAVLGAAVALHPLRLHRRKEIVDPLKTGLAIRAQILICSAGALMVIVIAGSLARAFGLVGLGSFVRFRTTMKDPTDLAVLFLLVGLGMACGFGAYGIALYGTVTIMVVLAALELRRSTSASAATTRLFTLTMKGPEALFNKALGHIRQKAEIRLVSFTHKPKKERGSVMMYVPSDFSAEGLLGELRPLGEFSEIGFEEGANENT